MEDYSRIQKLVQFIVQIKQLLDACNASQAKTLQKNEQITYLKRDKCIIILRAGIRELQNGILQLRTVKS